MRVAPFPDGPHRKHPLVSNEPALSASLAHAARLLGRAEFDAETLWKKYPPNLKHEGKRRLFEAAGGLNRAPTGPLSIARFAPGTLPPTFAHRPAIRSVEGPYEYATPEAATDEWHVNFANTFLFCAYGDAAFAQDEIQVAEHPVLGSLVEGLKAEQPEGLTPLTVAGDRPTPIAIRGAERWCAIDMDPPRARPFGIYGSRFRTAKPEALREAVTRLDGSYRTNLLAMEAPMGSGRYSKEQIQFILETAWTGFSGVRQESTAGRHVTIHTGHWGTGAYGGDRVLMALLQLIAARLAGIDTLVYHSIDGDGLDAFAEAAAIERRLPDGITPQGAIGDAWNRGFTWGASDGH